MGEAHMELGEREFERIGEYVKKHLTQWISESGVEIGEEKEALALRNRELDLVERVVRVEDELKNLREVMDERFTHIERRFEEQQKQMDRRFDHIEKRFTFLQWGIGIGFSAILVLMGVLNYLG